MSMQQFCLRWNNHQPNFISVCSSLLHNGTLVDVTLAAEGRQLQAHKIVLSACSSYFQTLFTTNPCQHPIVILKDVQYDDLKTMVDFMYYGEVNVSQEQLPHILKTAEMLKIKGLAEMPTDPATLAKSDSKSSSEGTELVGGSAAQSGASAGGSAGGLGSSTSGSVGESIWGSTEAQFQQQHAAAAAAAAAAQQQQHHHHQQQQLQQQQQAAAAQQQQQQQAAAQQQQHHHHHHHHQQQQQQQQQQQSNSQTQTSQAHHQLRRTPSPLGVGTSPATRRKRLRKSSNNGSGDRNNSDEQHSSLDANNTSSGISLSQMSQMSFGTGAGATLGNLSGHSLHTAKLLKESANADLEQHPQDSDLEDGHGHIHMQIKPEVDIGGVNQSIPLDISGATTPSEHDAPNSQSSHSELTHQLSSSSSFVTERATSTVSPPVSSTQQMQQQLPIMGTKRNRVLTRQPRVKRDSDSLSSSATATATTTTTQVSPDPGTTLDFDPFNAAGAGAANYSTTSLQQHVAHQQSPQQQQQHQQAHLPPHHHLHHHHHHLLTVPPRIERHASEPAPSLTPSSPHLLSVPQTTPYLIKQHSDPLLPSQHSAAHASSPHAGATNPFAPLHRQYSHPLSGSNAASYVTSAPLHHPHHISLPESIYASGSPPPAGSSQYVVPQQHIVVSVNNNNNSNDATCAPTAAIVTSVVATNTATTATSPSPPCSSSLASGVLNTTKAHSLPQFTTTYVSGESCCSRSPSIDPEPERLVNTNTAHSNSTKLRSSKSTDGRNSGIHLLHPGQATTTSSSFEHLPTLRVKNEELQRSVSSPQTQREIITLENPRSSHCPVIRPGPALGCNFCWNTIDGHGRILRRKTKYHCPECQTNLCIVPCFQEYHERLNNEAAAAAAASSSSSSSNTTTTTSSNNDHSHITSNREKGYNASGNSSSSSNSRHYAKTESI